jgi:carbonic anhydrase
MELIRYRFQGTANMTYHARSQASCLIFGLILSLSATAEEHAAPAAPAPAPPKPAAAAKAEPAETAKPAPAAKPVAAAKTEPVEMAKPAETARPAAATATPASTTDATTPAGAAKLIAAVAAAKAAVARKYVDPVVAFHPHAKPKKSAAAPMRTALSTGIPVKPAEGAATTTESEAPHTLHWSYEGKTGPQAWAKLAPEFAKCGSGDRQSPIDIREGMKLDLEPITFEYRPSGFKVIDNGHTVQANVNGWNSMRVMGRRFKLVQFHFHTPSEESIDGRQYDMVVHLVHKDGEGRLGVVAVLVENGARQPAIQAVLNNLPLEKNLEVTAGANLDLSQILPADRRYFTYMGSLTTPPCTEDVLWIVMKQPVQASPEQLGIFSRMYPMNARPTQATSGRMIKESN